jgi:uncharacterized protein (DUF488 family)
MSSPADAVTIWTVGHSTLPIQDFLKGLTDNAIEAVADVRRFPASRRHPQFERERLTASLQGAGIQYLSFTDLGGRRATRPDSVNTAWRNASFRGYADYMETLPFRDAVARLVAGGTRMRTAIMCAEALWWRCHRALIADFLQVSGVHVLHIASSGAVSAHRLTPPAQVMEGRLSYAGEPSLGL